MQRDMRLDGADHPQVVAVPPVIYAGAFGLGLILEGLVRTDVPGSTLRFGLGALLLIVGIGLMWSALRAFRAAGTHVEPYLPATALVTTGPYRFTRNPIYLGMTSVYLGAGSLSDSLWILLLAIPVLALMHYGVVLREEAYLTAKFGGRYQDYTHSVRRWI
ncbi:MAG TPA: isoprenylcysteine carboxylmethyltransferase family protein [bacterium]